MTSRTPSTSKPGTIDPHRWYSKSAVLAMGFGLPDLMDARRAKVVNARESGQTIWVSGAELIAWLASRPVATVRAANSQYGGAGQRSAERAQG